MTHTQLVRLACLWLSVQAISHATAADGPPNRPNIVFFLTDDHAARAISSYGSKLLATPNLDRIASGGVRFDHCFCTESICGPSRAAILTGKYGHVTGAMGWKPYDRRHRTFPEHLQTAGYQTAHVGKYHLGNNPPGFDYYDILPGQGRYHDPEFISAEGRRSTPLVGAEERPVRQLQGVSVRSEYVIMCGIGIDVEDTAVDYFFSHAFFSLSTPLSASK